MTKDQRLYGKFTINFPTHEKIAILSDAAFRCLVEATLWCREQERDGWLARRYAVARWGLEVLQELSTNDPEKPSLVEGKNGFDGWYIHDYAEHQETKADIEARRERNKRNGQKGGLAKAGRVGNQPASESLSESVAEKESEEEEVTTTAKAVVGAKPKRGQRIRDDWKPSDTTKEWARENYSHLNLNHEYQAFMDHWLSASGQSARKLDWDRAFKNWLRNSRSKPARGDFGGPSVVDSKVNDWLTLANQQPTPHLKAIGE